MWWIALNAFLGGVCVTIAVCGDRLSTPKRLLAATIGALEVTVVIMLVAAQ